MHLVPHHFAHASAAARGWPDDASGIVFAWDGVGYGPDGSLWGGEALAGRPGAWRRQGHMRPFRLPGGDRAGREPWRSAAATCWETGLAWEPPIDEEWRLARQAWGRGINSPTTTAVGRLFDAAASLTGLVQVASFEGQGPMQLEAVADPDCADHLALPLGRDSGCWVTDWAPLIELLSDEGLDVCRRAAVFHTSLAAALADQVAAIRQETRVDRVALTGGVFQNRLLAERATRTLQDLGIRVEMDDALPVNDGGLCAGQIVEYAALASRAG